MPVYKCPKCGRTVVMPEGTYYCKECGPSAIMTKVQGSIPASSNNPLTIKIKRVLWEKGTGVTKLWRNNEVNLDEGGALYVQAEIDGRPVWLRFWASEWGGAFRLEKKVEMPFLARDVTKEFIEGLKQRLR